MKEKYDTHNLIAKEKIKVQRQHLEFLRRQAEEDQMTKDLEIFRTNKEDMEPQDLGVLLAMKEKICKRYLD